MLGSRLVVLADAHLGAAPREDEEALLAFLDAVPRLGDCLLVNGDLFDFWFSYRRVIPREGFRVTSALAALRRRVPIVMTGGNHDRWGDSFWQGDLDIGFAPAELRFSLGGLNVVALHGDGVAEEHRSAVFMHRVTSHPLAVRAYRALHPDLGFRLVGFLSRHLADSTRDPAVLERAAARQQHWAKDRLGGDPSIGLLVMAHTHRPALAEPFPGRRYLNPGAWIEGRRYAVASGDGVELKQW